MSIMHHAAAEITPPFPAILIPTERARMMTELTTLFSATFFDDPLGYVKLVLAFFGAIIFVRLVRWLM